MASLITPAIPAGGLAASGQPHLRTADGRLVLRPWQAADAPALYFAFQDPVIRRWHARHMVSADEAREWIAGAGRAWREERAAQWAVVGGEDGEVLGRMGLRVMELDQGFAECAYWVLPAARGAAVAPRALAAMADWALEDAGFHRLELRHSVENEASCRVAGKAGFGLEGTRLSSCLHADGWHDMHVHTRIQDRPEGRPG